MGGLNVNPKPATTLSLSGENAARAHRGAVAGIGAVTDEALEAERVDLCAGEPHCLCSAAEVAAGVLRGAGEVVLAAGRDLLGEVAPAEGPSFVRLITAVTFPKATPVPSALRVLQCLAEEARGTVMTGEKSLVNGGI